jgi:hypothetical protein
MKCNWPKYAVAYSVLLCSVAACAQTKFQDLDDSALADNGTIGWGSCVTCAGGASNNATISSSPFQTSPSKDGDSRDFYISGDAYSNGLWWYKVGPNNNTSHFTLDFWLNVASNTQSAQALEFDTFQFVSGREFMFGMQCNYASGTWDVWNGGKPAWVHSRISCRQFNPNVWYHLTLGYHRSNRDNYLHYDTLTITQYNQRGRVVGRNSYNVNLAFPSQNTPPGWGDNLGANFQMDIGSSGAEMQEWVDKVTLTAW